MHRSTKRFVAKTGIAVGVGVGSFLAARNLEAENPHKADVEWLATVALGGSALAVARRGASAFAIRTLENGERKDEAKLNDILSTLPQIEKINNPLEFYRHITTFGPKRLDNSTKHLLDPVIHSFAISPEINVLKFEALSWTVDALRNRMTAALTDPTKELDFVQVEDAAWFLDQTFPIAISDTETHEASPGEKNWYNFILGTVQLDETV